MAEVDYDEAESIGMEEARRMLRGRSGMGCSLEAIRRWASPSRGRPVRGAKVVLKAVRIGGRLRTMRQWVEAFASECIAAAKVPERPPLEGYRTPRQRAAAHRRAEKELDRMGIR